MLLAIISAILAYRRARDTGRNAVLWAFIAAATFIGTQLIVQVGIGFALGLGIAFFGWSETILEKYSILATLAAIVCSFISTGLILRYLNRVPEEDAYQPPPPPPSNFN